MSRIYDALKDAEHKRTTAVEPTTDVSSDVKSADDHAVAAERPGLVGALKSKLFSSAAPAHGNHKGRSAASADDAKMAKPEAATAKAVEPSGERHSTGRSMMDVASPAGRASNGSASAALPDEDHRPDPAAGRRGGPRGSEAVGLSEKIDLASAEIASVEAGFSRLAEALIETARNLQQTGAAPSEGFIAEVTNCRRDFQAAGATVTKLARTIGVPAQYLASPAGSIGDLRVLLEVAAFHDNRHQAMAVLDRVLAIAHRDGAEFSPLVECQAGARQLREAVSSSDWPAPHPESQSLATGEHSFAKLAILVERGEQLSDEQWLSFHDAVSDSFGKPLAVAITRNRLRLDGVSSPVVAATKSPVEESAPRRGTSPAEGPDNHCWSCNAELEGGAKFCGECGAPAA